MSGPRDFAVRDLTHFVFCANRVHRIPRPTFVTIAKRPSPRARDGGMVDVIWCFGQLRHVGATGKSPLAGDAHLSSPQKKCRRPRFLRWASGDSHGSYNFRDSGLSQSKLLTSRQTNRLMPVVIDPNSEQE
jgi:hypothetical protein